MYLIGVYDLCLFPTFCVKKLKYMKISQAETYYNLVPFYIVVFLLKTADHTYSVYRRATRALVVTG